MRRFSILQIRLEGQVAVEFAKLVQRTHGGIIEPGGDPIAVEAEQDASTPWYHNESEKLVPFFSRIYWDLASLMI
jgi:hypothetical protein